MFTKLLLRGAARLGTGLTLAIAGLTATRADDAERAARTQRDEALDRELNGFRAPILRPEESPFVLDGPLYQEEPAAAQQDFRPPPPPPPPPPRKPTPPPQEPPPQEPPPQGPPPQQPQPPPQQPQPPPSQQPLPPQQPPPQK